MCNPGFKFKLAVCSFLAACSSLAADYFIAANGSDERDGRSPETAWATPARVSASRFQPGDRIFFKAGDTFRGTITLSKEDSGTETASVEIGSFGAGRATIHAGNESGILTTDVENLVIRNLVVVGAGPLVNTEYGVHIENTATNRMLKQLLIDSVEIKGFGKHGAMVTGQTYGYENVRIQRCSFHQNRKGGLEVAGKLPWDAKIYAHKNVTVSECRAFDNPGDSTYTKNHSGSGIVLYQVDGGRIEKCTAWNNGEFCPAGGGGPVGIWTCASRRVIIEYCESFANKTQGMDGGGFDIDGGSEECVLQYNYSHDNEGPGLMVYTYPYASYQDRGNVVRFNISIGDAVRSDRYGGLYVRAYGRKMERLEIYNNTVVTSRRYAALIHAEEVDAILSNNLFISASDGIPLRVDVTNQANVKFQHNLYWRDGAPFLVQWGGRELKSLGEFRTVAQQEFLRGEELGLFVDPQITRDTAPSARPVENLRALTQFKPRLAFVGIGGKRIANGIDSIDADFLGNDIAAGRIPLGAVGLP